MKKNTPLPVSPRAALVVSLLGAVAYPSLEVLWRGYTHPSMAVAGAVACLLLYCQNSLYAGQPRLLRGAVGAWLILLVEFVVGVVVNLFLGEGVWDYSAMPLDLLGQVCPAYAALWLPLAIAFTLVFDRVRQEVAEAVGA